MGQKQYKLPKADRKIERASKTVAHGFELVLVTILRTINFLLGNFVRFCIKDIKGIYFLMLTIVFICILTIMKLTYDARIEMNRAVYGMEQLTTVLQIKQDCKCDATQGEVRQESVPIPSYDTSKALAFMKSYRKGNSPLINYLDSFFKGDIRKGKLALAICGGETAFGTVGAGIEYFNCFGWRCTPEFNCNWKSWDEAISSFMGNKYLGMFDGTVESLVKIADAGYYPTYDEAQLQWSRRIQWFYNNL